MSISGVLTIRGTCGQRNEACVGTSCPLEAQEQPCEGRAPLSIEAQWALSQHLLLRRAWAGGGAAISHSLSSGRSLGNHLLWKVHGIGAWCL